MLAVSVTSTSMGAMGNEAPGIFTKQPPATGSVTGRLPPVFILLVVESISNSHEKVPSPFSKQLGCLSEMPLSMTCSCTKAPAKAGGALTRMLVSRPWYLVCPVLSALARHSAPGPVGPAA